MVDDGRRKDGHRAKRIEVGRGGGGKCKASLSWETMLPGGWPWCGMKQVMYVRRTGLKTMATGPIPDYSSLPSGNNLRQGVVWDQQGNSIFMEMRAEDQMENTCTLSPHLKWLKWPPYC
jgi:hypothetical protein